ncbi:MAG: hypothetical protein IPM24_24620 [Bryobacterales bacterium]|nr:hypothetical protein [Bryobacterales bacterium]
MKRALGLAAAALVVAGASQATEPIVIYPKLPEPLKLPPGLVQTLPLNKTASYFGDTLRAVDCEDDRDLPFGLCGNELFGGMAMTSSHLSGNITIRFYPPVRNIAHFEVIHNVLPGEDSVLVAPQGYELPVLFNQVSDPPNILSEGDVDLETGGVSNLKYRVVFFNSSLLALANVNPKLESPVIEFPGVRGHAWARFEPREDGLLDFSFEGGTFLPLGKDIEGDPVRWPMPFCGPGFRCASILARGTSLHPHLTLSTKAPEGADCAPNCPDIPVNTIQEFVVNTHSTSFGDDFELDIPQLGGPGPGRSHLQGRLLVQFGPRTGDTVPFVIRSAVPKALLAEPPPSVLGDGFLPGLVGQVEFLRFPQQTYKLERVVFADEPFNFPHGMIDLRTGRILGEMVYPSYYGQSLAEVLFLQNDGRISTDPFFLVAQRSLDPRTTYARFEKGPNGQTVFRYSGRHVRSFAGFRFPSPDFVKANSFIAGPGGKLDIFLRMQGIRAAVPVTGRKTGGASNVLSSLGDRFSYSFSVPCQASGQTATFEYTNNNAGRSGGTFRLERLAHVSCVPSPRSQLAAGDGDIVTFTGFGSWSKDGPGDAPRFVSVQISTAPGEPYVGILVYQDPDELNDVILSSANTKPAEKPLP